MRLVTYTSSQAPEPMLGVRVGHRVLDVAAGSRVDGEPLPTSMRALLAEGRGALARVTALAKAAQVNAGRFSGAMLEERAVHLVPPVPDPARFHVVDIGAAPEVRSIGRARMVGHDASLALPAGAAAIACKPHLAFVLSRGGSALDAELEPLDHVAGITFVHMFDGSGAVAVGPELVTPDEAGDPEEARIVCSVNGREMFRREVGRYWSHLGAALERLSATEALSPGDIVAIELQDEALVDVTLHAGDVVETTIGRLGALRTAMVAA